MKLTEDQLNKLSSTLKISPLCPNCSFNGQFIPSHEEFQLLSMTSSQENLQLGGQMSWMPLVSITCPRCGYVRLFNLKTLGIV